LICGAMTWLKEFKENKNKQLEKIISDEENEKKKYYFDSE
jgi:hypothetical protein